MGNAGWRKPCRSPRDGQGVALSQGCLCRGRSVKEGCPWDKRDDPKKGKGRTAREVLGIRWGTELARGHFTNRETLSPTSAAALRNIIRHFLPWYLPLILIFLQQHLLRVQGTVSKCYLHNKGKKASGFLVIITHS